MEIPAGCGGTGSIAWRHFPFSLCLVHNSLFPKIKKTRENMKCQNFKKSRFFLQTKEKLTERFVMIELSESLLYFETRNLSKEDCNLCNLKFPPSNTTSGESRLCWCVVDVSEDRISFAGGLFSLLALILLIWIVTEALTCPFPVQVNVKIKVIKSGNY